MMKEAILSGLIVVGAGLCTVTGPAAAHEGRGQAFPGFEQLDADGDGQITQAEMTAHRGTRITAADTDGDGMLNQEEVTALVEARVARQVARMMERHDADGDGMINLEDLQPKGRRGARLFGWADADGSGGVSQEEFDEMKVWMERFARHRGGAHRHGQHHRHQDGDE